MQIKGGVDGIVPVGTTGESPTLDYEEHIEVIARAVEFAAGKIKVMAGTRRQFDQRSGIFDKGGGESRARILTASGALLQQADPGGALPAFPGNQPRHQTASDSLQRSSRCGVEIGGGDGAAAGGGDAPAWWESRKRAATRTG